MTDETVKEIIPSWFNTINFLVDLVPNILEQVVEFSGLRREDFKIVDEGFLNFLSKVNPTQIPTDVKRKLFFDIIKYHESRLQWIPAQLASAMSSFFDSSLEKELKIFVERSEITTNTKRYVPLGNIAYVIAYLADANISIDEPYWKDRLIKYVKDDNENGVLQRHALLGLEKIGDNTVIDELPNLLDSKDELVRRQFLSTCIELNADHPKSLACAIEAVKRNDFHGRFGIFKIKERSSIITFLKTYNTDGQFKKEFLDDTLTFKDKDSILISNIEAIFDQEIEELCKEAIVQSVQSYAYRSSDQSAFVTGLIRLLKGKNPNFISEILQRIHSSDKGSAALYFSQSTFVHILEKEDVPLFIKTMIDLGEKNAVVDTMMKIKYSKRDASKEIYEAGRAQLSGEYAQYENPQPGDSTHDSSRKKEVLAEFRRRLDPAPKMFLTDVFNYYINSADELDPILEKNDKDRLAELVKGSVLNQNPAQYGLTIQSEDSKGGSKTYTHSQVVSMFGDAILTGKRLGVDLTPYSKNIALFIPFASDEEKKEIFETLGNNFTSEDLESVVAIYKDKHSDLWRHRPERLVDLVKKYHLTEAVPILKDFVKQTEFEIYTKKEALEVIDSLSSDPSFLQEIFDIYVNSEEKEIAYVANGLLITAHGQREAVIWRIEEINKRVSIYEGHASGWIGNVTDLTNELVYDKPFAKPLTEVKYLGFEEKFLEMLDDAMRVWGQGKQFERYAQYMWEIVYSYFDNLKEHRSYGPLKLLEAKIASFKDREGVNWLAYNTVRLRRSYLLSLGKPKNFSEAILKYNKARNFSDKSIRNSLDLFRQLQNIITTDLRSWVEDDGAYNIIVSDKKYSKENNEYEKLVQMTIKSELSSICRSKGFDITFAREEQLLSGKKADFTVRYGFIGPITLEIKLGSNSDLITANVEKTKSYKNIKTYMKGYGACYGIFLIMDNTGKKHVSRAKEIYSKIPNLLAVSLDCYTSAVANRKNKKSKLKTSRKSNLTIKKRKRK